MQSSISKDLDIICDFINRENSCHNYRRNIINDSFKRIVDFCKDKENGNKDRHYHYFVGFSYGVCPTYGFGNYHFSSNEKIAGKDIKKITERIEKSGSLKNVVVISISPLECQCHE